MKNPTSTSTSMNGKPVLWRPAKTILNLNNDAFREKLLCDGITMNLGDACGFGCTYCYVGPMARKFVHTTLDGRTHEDVVIRRQDALAILRGQLIDRRGRPRFADPDDHRVVYSSTLVDVAANTVLMQETVEACLLILQHTHWQIRLLSKSACCRSW